jgi:DNA-binding CsgD family transcriptional regulator
MRLALALEPVRVGLCFLLMIVLLLALPWWLAVVLPLPAYAGLRLIAPTTEPTAVAGGRTPPPLDEPEAYQACQRLRAKITVLGHQVSDEENAKRVRAVDDRFGQILAVMAEDAKYSMSVLLLDLVGTTHELLSRYVKIVRRQLDDDEVHARVRDNLASIDYACTRLWRQVNRDTVINLEVISETIDETLKELGTPLDEAPPSLTPPDVPDALDAETTSSDSDRPDDVSTPSPTDEWTDTADQALDEIDEEDEPPALPSGSIAPPAPASSNGADPEASLTRREMEVLCLLVDGCSNRQIAVNLFISEGTTKRHVTNILAKLDVPSRSAAAAYANRRGLCCDTRPAD